MSSSLRVAMFLFAVSPYALGQSVAEVHDADMHVPASSKPYWVLNAVPDTCVTLQQGNECFQPITVSWQAPMSGDYCVHLSGEPKPLQCWQSATSGHYLFEFRSSRSRSMQLRRANQADDLDTAAVDVKWVYRQRRAGIRWRVF